MPRLARMLPTPARRAAVAGLVAVLGSSILPAATLAAPPSPTATVVQSGLVIPWDVAFTPDGDMLVTERPGRVRIYASGAVGAPLLRTITIGVHASGEAGLMGIAVDRDYAANRFVYVCASQDVTAGWRNRVLRYRVNSDLSWSLDRVVIDGMLANTIHNGCAVEMDRNGMLWVTMGDAANTALAQNPNSLNGKVLRVNAGGSIPSDNPIVPGAAGRTAAYSMGHRNPQGIAFRPGTDEVYVAEHGPDVNDEINRIFPGENYGWPCYTGAGVPYEPAGCGPASAYESSIWASGSSTIATSGMAFADGAAWADWEGHAFVSQLKESDLRRFTLNLAGTVATQQAILYDGAYGRLRAAVLGPGSQLFVTTSNGTNDRVIRISPAIPTLTRQAGPDRYATAAAVSAATFAPGVPVAFVATGENYPDAMTAAAAAPHRGGPLLLVRRDQIPPVIAAELDRLNPAEIVVLGGASVVSAGVEAALAAYAGAGGVRRLAGADRYGTAAAISADTFPAGVPAVLVATGQNFPDGLAGAPAAARLGGPLALVRRGAIPEATAAELQRLSPAQIYVLGGPAVVSDAVMAQLDAYTAGPVTRLSGPDRYGTAVAISAAIWRRADLIYLSTGQNFPDALVGGAAAGFRGAPLLMVPGSILPSIVGQEILRMGPSRIVILGGAGAVSDGVAAELQQLLASP